MEHGTYKCYAYATAVAKVRVPQLQQLCVVLTRTPKMLFNLHESPKAKPHLSVYPGVPKMNNVIKIHQKPLTHVFVTHERDGQ